MWCLAADPGEELMGKEDEPVFDGMPPIAVIFDAESWLGWFCTAARIWGNESPSAREKAWERSWAVSTKDGDVVTGAEETTEFATEEEESSEEVADESNMAAALLLVDCPESWLIKTSKEAGKTKTSEENCKVDLFKGELPGRWAVTLRNVERLLYVRHATLS